MWVNFWYEVIENFSNKKKDKLERKEKVLPSYATRSVSTLLLTIVCSFPIVIRVCIVASIVLFIVASPIFAIVTHFHFLL